jgi:dienelactone hydrolase
VCDRLAAAGLHVCAPDTFRDKPWQKERFPPKPEDDFMGWVSSEGGFEKVSRDIHAVGGWLRAGRGRGGALHAAACWPPVAAPRCCPASPAG